MMNRRTFLKSSSLLALAPTLPVFLARTGRAAEAARDGRVLVVVQLDGGNDALNTVIPHADPEYARLRPTLKQPAKELIKLNDSVGLHSSLKPLEGLLEKNCLAVVPGVSYPNPDRSHFRSMSIWQTAKFEKEDLKSWGWLGRALDTTGGNSTLIGPGTIPQALRGRRSAALSLARPEDLILTDSGLAKQSLGSESNDDLLAFVRRQAADGYGAAAQIARMTGGNSASYPETRLGQELRLAAGLLKADLGARVLYTVQGSYDTHATQRFKHADLLREFAGAVQAFFADLEKSKLAERVLLLAFSEFGRTIKENGSGGTDHGTTGCVFLAGRAAQGGLIGRMPSLTDLAQGEPKMTTDFRSVYATVLDRWLQCSSETVLGGRFESLPMLKS